MSLIEPRTLKGFRDYLPALMIPRERMLEKARQVFRSYGFSPIDTPALEYAEILTGKGGEESDRLLYQFKDHGGRDVALRFDLTVPLARFVAQHVSVLGTPFKRYHMGPVWRGENTSHGRYREFWQCDFDTIGTTSNAADIETALVINDLFEKLGFERFEIRVNSRLILNGVLEIHGLVDKAVPLLRALDKLQTQTNDKILTILQQQQNLAQNEKAKEGIRRLRELLSVAKAVGIPEGRIKIDLSIARGLDYYTGTIYETFLLDKPEIGSVCSGGRYDNLASLYTKQQLPGVGASLGLDRLLAAMEELKLLDQVSTPAPVLVVQFDAARLGDYQRIARVLRAEGIGVEVYPEARKIGQQLQYAEKRGFKVALIAGADEFAQGVWKIKQLATRTEATVPERDLVSSITPLFRRSERP